MPTSITTPIRENMFRVLPVIANEVNTPINANGIVDIIVSE